MAHGIAARVLLPRLAAGLKGAVGQQPHALGGAAAGGDPGDVDAEAGEVGGGGVVVGVLEGGGVGAQLVVEAGLGQRLGHGEVAVEDVVQVLDGGGDDAAAAGGADDEVQAAVGMLDDDGGHGGQRALAGADVVGLGGDVAEGVAGAGDAEVVHLVVHDEAGLGDHDAGAEEEVDGGGEGDGEAGGVGGGDVGGAGGLERLEAVGVVVRDVVGGGAGDAGADQGAGLGGEHAAGVGGHAVDEGGVAELGALAVGEAHGLVEAVDGGVAGGRVAEAVVAADDVEGAEGDDAARGRAAGRELVAAVRDPGGLADGDGVAAQVRERHGAVGAPDGGDGGVGDGARVEGVDALAADGLEHVGVSPARHGLVEPHAVPVGREVDGPRRVLGQEVAVGRGRVHVPDQVLVDAEAVARHLDRGLDHLGPGQPAVLVVEVLEAAQFTRDAAELCTPVHAGSRVVGEHGLEGGGRGGLAEVDELVGAVARADEREAAAAGAAVVHADDADAEDGGDGGVAGVAALLEDVGADPAADVRLGGDGAQLRDGAGAGAGAGALALALAVAQDVARGREDGLRDAEEQLREGSGGPGELHLHRG
ncbi:hypothetical protein CTA1_12423 [Colletotrichum tanaceti]|uniref:Uncharacterized protein n=1 Tax=Colletotrichum tanaceti TaxID=1306861 RepID=A0A4U6XA49_9PEZI|nr:hypothetical protein CTA1_12423 [Colletotrichum tanaceti]